MLLAADLRALREKYEEMLTLRELHARARSDATFTEPDPKSAMIALAIRFPGALREIDELPLETIRSRLTAIEVAELDASRITRWMIAQSRFHFLARGALAAKRWLGKRRRVDDSVRAAFRAADATHDDARIWADALDAIARPPRGRVLDVVFARLAEELAIDENEARVLVFGKPRRS